MPLEQREQRIAQKRTARQQAGDERILLIAAQRRVVELERPAARAFNQRGAGGNVPLILRNQGKC